MQRLIPYLLALTLAAAAHAATVDRVLRKFDFEERAAGNLEDVPMDWQKIEGPGLPHYVNGGLTTEQAYAGRYGFGFKLNGGSLIYRYPAGKIPVHAGAHYAVRVMAKTSSLDHARVRLTTYCTDAKGKPIRESISRSNAARPDEWSPLVADVTAPDGAAWLVIELGLMQQSLWRNVGTTDVAAYEQDIVGQAWFDDLTISQVPRVRLGTTSAGNVFRRSEPAVIDIELNDRLTEDLVGRLDVLDAGGRPVYQRTGNFDLRRTDPTSTGRLTLPPLPAGWYQASVAFTSGGQEVGRQSIAFVQLADDATVPTPDARVGVIATGLPTKQWDALPDLLPLLSASRVKLAIWSATEDVERTDTARFDRLIEQLRDARISIVGGLLAPPPDIARRIGGGTWAKLSTAPADAWQPTLSAMVTRLAGRVEHWQLCEDARYAEFAADASLRAAYATVRRPITDLLGQADLAMPWPVYADAPSPAPGELALSVPTDVLPPHLPLYVADEKSAASLSLQFLQSKDYGRPAQLRDLAQRVGFALATSAKRIDVPLPFDPEETQPLDTFLPLRTLLGTLSGTTYNGRLPLGPDVEALLFDRDGEGVVMAWTKSPQATPKTVAVMLGNAPRAVDLDGNVSAVLKPKSTDGTTDIVVGPTPSLIIGIDGALARLRTSFAFDNPLLESSYKPHVRRLKFVNPYPSSISGRLRISGPAGWTITPQRPTFNLAAGEAYEEAVTLEFPFSSLAGVKPVTLDVSLDGGVAFKVPLSFRLGLSDLGLDSSAFRDGPDVVVQQMITNYGNKPADYTAFASCPGLARQERIVRGLLPGTSVIKRYRFPNADPATVKNVRSGVRETQGNRQLTDEVALQ